MMASPIIEQESGTWYGRIHPHNGYYAGDFSVARQQSRRSESPRQLPQRAESGDPAPAGHSPRHTWPD